MGLFCWSVEIFSIADFQDDYMAHDPLVVVLMPQRRVLVLNGNHLNRVCRQLTVPLRNVSRPIALRLRQRNALSILFRQAGLQRRSDASPWPPYSMAFYFKDKFHGLVDWPRAVIFVTLRTCRKDCRHASFSLLQDVQFQLLQTLNPILDVRRLTVFLVEPVWESRLVGWSIQGTFVRSFITLSDGQNSKVTFISFVLQHVSSWTNSQMKRFFENV